MISDQQLTIISNKNDEILVYCKIIAMCSLVQTFISCYDIFFNKRIKSQLEE